MSKQDEQKDLFCGNCGHLVARVGHLYTQAEIDSKFISREKVLGAIPEKKKHNLMCPVSYKGFQEDQCNCGATAHNTAINTIRKNLGEL